MIQNELELQNQDSSGRDRTKMSGYCAGLRGWHGGLWSAAYKCKDWVKGSQGRETDPSRGILRLEMAVKIVT